MVATFCRTLPPAIASRGARDSKGFGRDGVARNFAVADFGDLRLAGQGNFVEAASAVNDERARDAKIDERLRHRSKHLIGIYAEDLRGGSRWIG